MLCSFSLAKPSQDFVGGQWEMRKPESQSTERQPSTPWIEAGHRSGDLLASSATHSSVSAI